MNIGLIAFDEEVSDRVASISQAIEKVCDCSKALHEFWYESETKEFFPIDGGNTVTKFRCCELGIALATICGFVTRQRCVRHTRAGSTDSYL